MVGNLEIGGTERVAQNFATSYAKLGHQSAVLACGAGGPRKGILNERGIEVFVGDGDMGRIGTIIDDFRPEIVHYHRPGAGSAWETEILRRARHPDRRILETNIFGRVDYSEGADFIDVHFQLSAWCMWKWRSCLGRDRNRRAGVVLPNAVDIESFRRADAASVENFRRMKSIPLDAYLCGRIGQPSPAKWHPQNLFAFAAVAEKDPTAMLLLVGLPDSLHPTLSRLPADTRRRILMLPTTISDSELCVMYSAMDCFLHGATIGESFGLVLAEAMLCSCPVVTASRPDRDNSHLELVGHGEGGLIAGSIRKLPAVALNLWSDPGSRARMSQLARPRITSRFGADDLAARAVRVGAIALASKDRLDLITALESDGTFQTNTSDEQLNALLRNTVGGASPLDLLRKRIIHRAWFQRALQKAKRWRQRA